jgi:hypothetical protein
MMGKEILNHALAFVSCFYLFLKEVEAFSIRPFVVRPVAQSGSSWSVSRFPSDTPLGSSHRAWYLPMVTSSSSSGSSSILVPQPSMFELLPGIRSIDTYNTELETLLSELREEAFFRLYSVDMLGSCEYMPQQTLECYTASCEIYAVESDDDDETSGVPQYIRSTDAQEYDFELDGWARWDMPTEDYYDTSQFPEEYTGYDGSLVWKFIHERICFPQQQQVSSSNNDWRQDFNKAVSGLHSMISGQIIRGIYEKKRSGQSIEGQWTDATVEFQRRLSPSGENPLALENLYFTYMLLLSAVTVAKERLVHDCTAGNIDPSAAQKLQRILENPLLLQTTTTATTTIGIASQTLQDHAFQDPTSLWEARMRTRELFRIMNCVQCNKCRLHGKISVLGLSTAFQILLGGDATQRIHRVEIASLMMTLSKFATSIQFCKDIMMQPK